MEKKEYLNEERYQKSRKKIVAISLMVLIIGCIIGGSLIVIGATKIKNANSKYSSDSQAELTKQIETEKEKLEKRKEELEEQGIKYNVVAKYTDGKEYELKYKKSGFNLWFLEFDFMTVESILSHNTEDVNN